MLSTAPAPSNNSSRVALALINIDEVHAGSGDLHQTFIRLWFRDWQIHQLQSFRAAGLGYLDSFHEGWIAEGVLGGRGVSGEWEGLAACWMKMTWNVKNRKPIPVPRQC
jgi:hypothetical protein